MPKEILFDAEASAKIISGIAQLAKAVKSTMGPHGKNVIISRDNRVAVTKDGASVAVEVELEDPIENVAAQLVKQIAHKTAIETGDGTTTATVLAEALYTYGLQKIADGNNAREVFEGMNQAIQKIVEELKAQSIKADSPKNLRDIATISANGDIEIGEWIAQAFEEVGFDGLVTAQLASGPESEFEIVKGLQINSGFLSPIFMTSEVPEIVYERPAIFLFDDKVKTIKEIWPIIEYTGAKNANMPIVIIAAGFDASLLPLLHKAKATGEIRPILIQAPAGSLPSFYADIAIAIGGTLVSAKNGHTLEILKTADLIVKHAGSCEKIIVKEHQTQILNGFGTQEAVATYVAALKEAIDSETTTASQKLILQERASRLEKGIAIIHVGGDSEIQQRERFDRVEDALGATRAAIAEGYVPGGGFSLYQIALDLNKNASHFSTVAVRNGFQAVLEAITAPLFTILMNAGYDPFEISLKVSESSSKTFGFNARTGEYVDLLEAGIIDPTKVTRRALENAASVANLILNSSCMMVKTTDKKAGQNFNMSL